MKVIVGILGVVVAILAWQVYELRTDAVTERDLADTFQARDLDAARREFIESAAEREAELLRQRLDR